MFDIQPLLDWIVQHPHWAGATVFLIALAESLALVGLFIPGTLAMFGVGALVAAGALNLWATLAWAAAGAIAGDGISYWLGYRYRDRLLTLWPFSRHPQWMTKGEAFFHRHGSKSILLGRFVGPVRPVIPAVAGMLGMPPLRFYLMNILSALGWAPAYILPGVVFGASLGVAGAVATRLVVLIALLLLAGGVGTWGIRHAILWLQPRFEAGLAHVQVWAAAPGAGRSFRGWINSLLDPGKPESRALLAFAGLLVLAAWGFFGILNDVVTRDPLVLIDSSVYHLLQGLRTPFGDSIMIALTELGDAAVTLTVVTAVLLWLLWQRAWRPAAYWLAAAGFAASLTMAIKAGLGRARPFPLYEGPSMFSFPSGHTTMSMVTYGFLAVLLARELSPRGRLMAFSAIIVWVALIAFSRLYLGAHWLSDVLGGVAFGMAWVAVLGIAYSRHSAAALSPGGLMIVAFSALLAGGTWQVAARHGADTLRYAARQEGRIMAQQDWWADAWQILPAWRIDIEGEYEQPLTVQWAGSLEFLRHRLLAGGWRDPLPAKSLLLWLDTTRPAIQLPLLPRVHDGRHEALALVHPVQNRDDRRLVLRLWPTDTVLRERGRPVWVGTVTRETLRRPLSWFNLPQDGEDFDQPRQVLMESLVDVRVRLARRANTLGSEVDRIKWEGWVVLALEPDKP